MWKRAVLALALLWLAFLLWITWAGRRSDLRRVDCLLVLGASTNAQGVPGPMFAARCQRAVELYREGWAPRVMFCGGRGSSGSVEGLAGLNYALQAGLPQRALFYEGWSHDTRENFLCATVVMLSQGWRTCLVVTDPFHEPRALALAGDMGLEAYPAPTFAGPSSQRWGTGAFFTLRESLCWLNYLWERF